jgi:hypothetical protein
MATLYNFSTDRMTDVCNAWETELDRYSNRIIRQSIPILGYSRQSTRLGYFAAIKVVGLQEVP